MSRLFSSIWGRWQGATDGAGLAIVRMCVALSVLIEMLQIWFSDGVAELIVDPQFHFKYTLFEWIGPPRGMMPSVFVLSLAAVAAMVFIGWRTRWTAALLSVGYVYWFLIDAANYTDHRYLVCLLTVLVAWLPTNRWASVDAYMGRETHSLVPGWSAELLRTQISLVYLFFGLSLLNSDWLHGAPLVAWAETDTESAWAAWFAGKRGLVMLIVWLLPIVYLCAIPALWWRRTRWLALAALAVIHLWDALTFQLTVSPWLLTGVTLVFCDTSGLRAYSDQIVKTLSQWRALGPVWKGLCLIGLAIDRSVSWFDDTPLMGGKAPTRAFIEPAAPAAPVSHFPAATSYFVLAWLLIQCWLPIRYLSVESQPDWTDLATLFAWRGNHRDKQCELKMSAIQPSLELRWPLDPTDEFPVPQAIFYTEEQLEKLGLSEGTLKDLVSGPADTQADRFAALKVPADEVARILAQYRATLQLRLAPHQYEQLVQRPEFVRQYAHRIGAVLNGLLRDQVQLHADLKVKLNQRPAQTMLSDDVEDDLLIVRSANELAERLPPLKAKLPPADEQILVAREWAERRRRELEQDFDIVLDKNRGKGEPVKLPALSDADEKWFQEMLAKRK